MKRNLTNQTQVLVSGADNLSRPLGLACAPLPKGLVALLLNWLVGLPHRLAFIFHRLASNGAVAPLGRRQSRDLCCVPGFTQVDRHTLRRPFNFFLRFKSG
jgi:hypothetical protein